MNILSHEEAKSLSYSSEDILTVIRNTEQAVIKALAAGVSVDDLEFDLDHAGREVFHRTDVETAIAAARVQENERCAKECDRTASDYKGMFAEDESLYIAATDCAKEIRALIGAKT